MKDYGRFEKKIFGNFLQDTLPARCTRLKSQRAEQ